MKFLILLAIFWTAYVHAQLPPCFYRIEADFFSYTVVAAAFSNNGIQQSLWPVLYQQLQQNIRYIPSMVEQAAAQINPNPLNPYQPLIAGELLKRVLYKVFHDTMMVNQRIITNRIIHESDIRQMFNFIHAQQSAFFSSCFGVESEASQRVTE